MKTVEIDRDGACIKVSWRQGATQKWRSFPAEFRETAESFAMGKAGARGCVISSLDMTPAQLAALAARRERAAALAATFKARLYDTPHAEIAG